MAKLKTAPHTARLITLNHADGRTFEIIPNGDGSVFVDVPNDLVKTKFVKNLIDAGILIKGDGDDSEVDEEMTRLLEEAARYDIKVDKRWKAERIQQEIDKAKAPTNPEPE